MVTGTVLFVLGFSAVFALIGLAVGGVGQLLQAHTAGITQVLGGVTILLGLLFFGAFDRFMFAGRVFKPSLRPRAGLAGAPLLGVMFGVGWTPCIGPTLSAVEIMSLQSGTAARGAFLAFIYGLGLGIPFLLVAADLPAHDERARLLQAQRQAGQQDRRRDAGGRGPARGDRRVDAVIVCLHTSLVRRLQAVAVSARFRGASLPWACRRLGFPRLVERRRVGRGVPRRLGSGGTEARASLAASIRAVSNRRSSPSSGCQLDADAEPVAVDLERLGYLAVRRPAGDGQPLAEAGRGPGDARRAQ